MRPLSHHTFAASATAFTREHTCCVLAMFALSIGLPADLLFAICVSRLVLFSSFAGYILIVYATWPSLRISSGFVYCFPIAPFNLTVVLAVFRKNLLLSSLSRVVYRVSFAVWGEEEHVFHAFSSHAKHTYNTPSGALEGHRDRCTTCAGASSVTRRSFHLSSSKRGNGQLISMGVRVSLWFKRFRAAGEIRKTFINKLWTPRKEWLMIVLNPFLSSLSTRR